MPFSLYRARMIPALVGLAAIVASGSAAYASGYRTIYRFQGGNDGWFPIGVPAVDKNGDVYGSTVNGGAYNLGTVYKLTAPRTRGGKWGKTVLHHFASNEGGSPVSLVLGKNGNLYGADYSRNIFELTPPISHDGVWKYTLLYSLNGTSDGEVIDGNLVFDAGGNLYGATELGGDLGCLNGQSCGTVFELQRPTTKGGKWHFTVLHTFTGQPDAAQPFAGVTFDQNGNLYGTTFRGGSYDWGAVYRASPPKKKGREWTETVIYSFDQSNDNIISPQGPVAFDSSGSLYGTTPLGGDLNCQGGYGCGVVFQLAATTEKDGAWTYSTVYEFQGGNDGIDPQGYMVFDTRGDVYSTTYGGGAALGGAAFRLKPPPSKGGSWTETVLHWFPENKKDGYEPAEGLTWGKSGNLYGVAWYGGGVGCPTFGCGTVFELQP